MDGMLMKAMLGQSSTRFAPDLAVLYGCLCSCAHVQLRRPRVVWKVKIMNIFCSTPLSIPRHTDSDAMLGVASFASVRAQAWSKVNWVLH